MTDKPGCEPPADAYSKAVEMFRVCRRELGECDSEIDVARLMKDTAALRLALSRRNTLLDIVAEAKEKVQQAAVDVVRYEGMSAPSRKPEPKAGLLGKAVEVIGKVLKG